MLNIAPNKIFVGINYIHETERTKVFAIDKANAIILQEVLHIAVENIKRTQSKTTTRKGTGSCDCWPGTCRTNRIKFWWFCLNKKDTD